MPFFKSKDSVTIAELENRIAALGRAIDTASRIKIGKSDGNTFWRGIDHRLGVSVVDVVRLLMEQQGLELKHTAASEKIELVKIKEGVK